MADETGQVMAWHVLGRWLAGLTDDHVWPLSELVGLLENAEKAVPMERGPYKERLGSAKIETDPLPIAAANRTFTDRVFFPCSRGIGSSR